MKTIRKPSFKEAIIPIIAMFVILVIGRGVYSAPIETLLIMSAAVAAVIAWRVGLTWDDMIEGVSEKIAKAMPAILILIAVGIVVGTWMLSGTIPMLIYYGIQIVNPKFFFLLVLSFVQFYPPVLVHPGAPVQRLVLFWL